VNLILTFLAYPSLWSLGRNSLSVNRKDKILYCINKNSMGVEIGPSYNPIAPKKDGYRVNVIDYLDRKQLLENYKDNKINLQLDNIEEVDFVWHGETYAELTGKRKFYDWIIASHVIEHTPDLIGFLNNCDEILKDDGVISLVIPDKRFCFDHYRPTSSLLSIIDSHLQKHTIHTPGTVAECFLNAVSKGGRSSWDRFQTGQYTFNAMFEQIQNDMKRAIKKEYVDVHAWNFTPHAFRLIMHDLHSLGFIQLKEAAFFPTYECEFYVTLSRKGDGVKFSRLDMLKIIDYETDCEFSWKSLEQVFRQLYVKVRPLAGRLKRWVKTQAQ
jgi:2-polyprenyl-3-methyl-5-hydroxy-6-metoxy-1,4-benzoquinol methylase